MLLITENSRRVAESRPVCVGLKAHLHGRFSLRFSPFGGCEGVDYLKVLYSPYVNKAFVYIFVSKILSFIRQLFIFSSF
jgi:hypothetical protein